jgi:chromosome segregation ATPase
LEERREYARQALEHFRTSAKEQRDQELRRHAPQVQQLRVEIRAMNGTLTEKLSQLTQINRDAASLSTENGNLRTQLQQVRSDGDRVEKG